jgi:diguanylate cyclase (GGDEF)-like protein
MDAAIAMQGSELARIIEQRSFDTLFQPLFDAVGERIHGHEALTRGPAGSALRGPLDLLAAARAEGRSIELDLLLIDLAIERFGASGAPGRLFINVLPVTLLGCGDLTARIGKAMTQAGLRPRDLVIEVTEHGLTDDASLIHSRVQPLRRLGCEIAIDDLGAGSSGLKIWTELRPDYVKLDSYFTAQLERDTVVAEMMRSMLDMAHVMGSRVVAEGVENERQLELLRGLGVDYLQGFHLRRPQSEPLREVPRAEAASAPGRESAAGATCAGELLIERPPLPPTARIEQVVALFHEHEDWDSLAVVFEGRPVGLVRRDTLLTMLSKPLYPEIYNRKPVVKVMEIQPVVVDARARLDQVSRLVTGANSRRVNEDFLIARHGEYAGIGRTMELLRQITAQQVQAAKQSNPLTLLPGNREIDQHLFRLLALRVPFVLCHADIDFFKSFNDEYGYRQGDQVLLHVADLLRGVATPDEDFVGHIGGDDYILVLRAGDWRRRINQLIDSFGASVPNFYSAEHRARRAIDGHDRDGAARSFPLMTLSVGIVAVSGEQALQQEILMKALQRAKSHAKSVNGSAAALAGAEIAAPSVGEGASTYDVCHTRELTLTLKALG